MDGIEIYDKNKELVDGEYYVETNQYFPMRGNGMYSRPIIEKCLASNLITHDNIKYFIHSNLSISPTYYNDFIDLCQSNLIKNDEIKELYKKYNIDDTNIDF